AITTRRRQQERDAGRETSGKNETGEASRFTGRRTTTKEKRAARRSRRRENTGERGNESAIERDGCLLGRRRLKAGHRRHPPQKKEAA
ncbi:hypothetical protein TGMAS_417380, partial [Toxoplasma gondii MAS]